MSFMMALLFTCVLLLTAGFRHFLFDIDSLAIIDHLLGFWTYHLIYVIFKNRGLN